MTIKKKKKVVKKKVPKKIMKKAVEILAAKNRKQAKKRVAKKKEIKTKAMILFAPPSKKEFMGELYASNIFIERCEKLRALVPQMEASGYIDFSVVRHSVGGRQFTCWYGSYMNTDPNSPNFDFDKLSQYFGCTLVDAQLMFGGPTSATFHQRVRHLDAHIKLLKRQEARRRH